MSSTVSVPVFDKKKHVLLIPDLFPIHMELLANVIRASGYRVEVLRTHGADVMEAGLKYIHNDMCYPAICSLGRELSAARAGLGQVKRNLKNIARSFAEIPVKAAKKVKVGIVGEVYVKYSPFANNQLEEFLQNQDCEYMLPGVLGFLRYCLSSPAVDWELYGGSRFSREVSVFLGRVIGRFEAALSRALAGYPQFHTPPSFRQMREKGERILSKGVKMGEGWYLPAEMVELIESGYDRIICAQPFGCLPNHIVGRGTLKRFRELYPQAHILPLDYDASLSRVNQENRIKLLLTDAREKMTQTDPAPVPTPAAPGLVSSF